MFHIYEFYYWLLNSEEAFWLYSCLIDKKDFKPQKATAKEAGCNLCCMKVYPRKA